MDKFSVILPNSTKFRSTLLDRFHYDLLRIFANEMDKENTVFIAEGFSFDDDHLFDITRRGLKNPTLRLVVFSFNKTDSDDYEAKFSEYSNVDIVCAEKTDIDFAVFNALLREIPSVNGGTTAKGGGTGK